ncbi:hypothetical protein DOK67_0000151 [Enterococcus sp. DIV0212c]|uniref:hypothetical protein n=1 Tax=Enterococcus sp. DIV0212c TaxID=2230867 RepID=UPI001A9C1DBC|nr:hypothetical protein [Enterococcus sp. DIV0212c]MBO1353999.1 hypothetical protein [Enterococcus sp. DIV0212c]
MLNESEEEIKARMQEDDFVGYVDEILQAGQLIDSPASVGIAKQIISNDGIETLSLSQLETFIKYGIDTDQNYLRRCDRCDNELPWSEMSYGAFIGLCSYCQQMESHD